MNLFFTLLFTVELGFNAFSHWYAPVVKLWFDQSSVQPSSSASTPSPTGTPRVNTVVPWSNPVVKLWSKDWSKFGTAGLPRLVPLARSAKIWLNYWSKSRPRTLVESLLIESPG